MIEHVIGGLTWTLLDFNSTDAMLPELFGDCGDSASELSEGEITLHYSSHSFLMPQPRLFYRPDHQ